MVIWWIIHGSMEVSWGETTPGNFFEGYVGPKLVYLGSMWPMLGQCWIMLGHLPGTNGFARIFMIYVGQLFSQKHHGMLPTQFGSQPHVPNMFWKNMFISCHVSQEAPCCSAHIIFARIPLWRPAGARSNRSPRRTCTLKENSWRKRIWRKKGTNRTLTVYIHMTITYYTVYIINIILVVWSSSFGTLLFHDKSSWYHWYHMWNPLIWYLKSPFTISP